MIAQNLQKLRELINSKNMPLGTTEGGRDWCIKALHPSDPLTEIRGIPDESSVPSFFMNYQTVATLSPSGNPSKWEADMQLMPHPFTFMAGRFNDGTAKTFYVGNSQLEGFPWSLSSYVDVLNAWVSGFRRWRLAYASVTIYQDGPDLSNQGTVVACQRVVAPDQVSVSALVSTTASSALMHRRALYTESFDLPNYAASQGMPNAYFGRSRDGLYMPLRLTKTHQQWHSLSDLVYNAGCQGFEGATISPYTNAAFTTGGTDPSGTIRSATSSSAVGYWPHFLTPGLAWDDTNDRWGGALTPDYVNGCRGDISFRNLGGQTSLSMFFRYGFEVQCNPTSIMSPHQKISPPYDPQAISAYFAISREMKDAYPAEFNDLGKIWDVISGVAKTVAPALSFVPGVGPLLAAAAPVVAGVGDRIRRAVTKTAEPGMNNVASQADREIALEVVHRPLSKPIKLKKKKNKVKMPSRS